MFPLSLLLVSLQLTAVGFCLLHSTETTNFFTSTFGTFAPIRENVSLPWREWAHEHSAGWCPFSVNNLYNYLWPTDTALARSSMISYRQNPTDTFQTSSYCSSFYIWRCWEFPRSTNLPSSVKLIPMLLERGLLFIAVRWLLLPWSTGSRWAGSVVVAPGLQSAGSAAAAQGLSCSAACGIFPDQGSNPCPLHWQADS